METIRRWKKIRRPSFSRNLRSLLESRSEKSATIRRPAIVDARPYIFSRSLRKSTEYHEQARALLRKFRRCRKEMALSGSPTCRLPRNGKLNQDACAVKNNIEFFHIPRRYRSFYEQTPLPTTPSMNRRHRGGPAVRNIRNFCPVRKDYITKYGNFRAGRNIMKVFSRRTESLHQL